MVAGLPLQRSSRRHGAPTDRAMFAAAPRCEAEADARCVLVSAVCTRMESACRRDHAPALIVVCTLRLMEQACGCSTVQGGGRLKVRARLCRWHSGGECLPPGPSSCTCRWFGCCSGADLRLPLI